jgi:hypothetical protein
MKLRDIVLERALPRLVHEGSLGAALGGLATMAGTRIMRRRILRSGTNEICEGSIGAVQTKPREYVCTPRALAICSDDITTKRTNAQSTQNTRAHVHPQGRWTRRSRW